MPLTDNTWFLVPAAIAASKVVELCVTSVYKTLSGNRYVTKKDCEKCQNSKQGAAEELKDDMKLVRGILLVVAVKVGVPENDWKKLAE